MFSTLHELGVTIRTPNHAGFCGFPFNYLNMIPHSPVLRASQWRFASLRLCSVDRPAQSFSYCYGPGNYWGFHEKLHFCNWWVHNCPLFVLLNLFPGINGCGKKYSIRCLLTDPGRKCLRFMGLQRTGFKPVELISANRKNTAGEGTSLLWSCMVLQLDMLHVSRPPCSW